MKISRVIRVVSICATSWILGASPSGASPVSFEAAVAVGPNTVSFPWYRDPLSLAHGSSSVWLVAWVSSDDLGGTIGDDADVVYVRSTDGGVTWSTVQPLNSDASMDAVDDEPMSLVTDGNGTWVAVWERIDPNEGRCVDGRAPTDVYFTRSTDDGATWSAPQPLHADAATDTICDVEPVVATDGKGRWIASWSFGNLGFGSHNIFAVRSDDGGATWTSREVISATDYFGLDVQGPRLVGAPNGTWILTYKTLNGTFAQEFVRSVDGGLTWSAPVALSFCGLTSNAALTTDAAGTWMLACATRESGRDVFMLRSIDDGATWEPERLLDPNGNVLNYPNGGARDAQLVFDPTNQRWVAFWESNSRPFGRDSDVLMSISEDNGDTWQQPVAINGGAARDDKIRDWSVAPAFDGAGTWIAAYLSTPPSSTDANTPTVARAVVDCPPTPRNDCFELDVGGEARLAVRRNPGRKNALKWKWNRGQPFGAAEIGDPTTTSKYLLCAYDEAATVPKHVFEKDLPVGGTCSGAPCWSTDADQASYIDKKRERTAVQSVDLEGIASGHSRIRLKSGGPSLGLPDLPLQADPAVTLQLSNQETGACWSSRFDEFRKHSAEELVAIERK